VGRTPGGGDAVGPDDDHVDLLLLHEASCRVVGDERDRDSGTHQFIGRQPCALQERAGFTRIDLNRGICSEGGPDDAHGGSVVGRGQSPGVAVSEDPCSPGNDLGSPRADSLVGGHIFPKELISLLPDEVLKLGHGRLGVFDHHGVDLFDGPGQVVRCRACRTNLLTHPDEFLPKCLGFGRQNRFGSNGKRHGPRNADGRSPPNRHALDGIDHLPHRCAAQKNLAVWQYPLVQYGDHISIAVNRG
jgi:hypothetical protein